VLLFNITISTNHVSATAGIAITPITISNRGDSISHYSIYPAIRNGLSFNKKTMLAIQPFFTNNNYQMFFGVNEDNHLYFY
jgi:hypothetical protein